MIVRIVYTGEELLVILAGIDEAGYGPLLGPLVVSAAVFKLPQEHLKQDLWHVLSDAVGKQKKHLAGRLLITDSKKAYTKSSGISQLRRTVLSALSILPNSHPDGVETTEQLLSVLCPECAKRLAVYPWYDQLGDCLLGADRDDIEISAGVLAQAAAKHDIHLADLSSYCFDVGHYNLMVSAVKNKAAVLFTAVCTLIHRILKADYARDCESIQILIDRQGGRVNYVSSLQKMFPAMELKVLKQSDAGSSYEMTGYGKTVKIHFAAKADDRFLPVALASMTSKYLREVLVHLLNKYFCNFHKDLKPTAGYWTDGQRFVRDIAELLPHVTYDKHQLIRMR